MSKIVELFGISTAVEPQPDWYQITSSKRCPFLERLCLKNRKSQSDVLIGSCTVLTGKEQSAIVICPHRLLERRQIFSDCIHLLTLHEPGNEFHILSEVPIPGGTVDYFLVSADKQNRVKDFVGIELQTLDTTGNVWPERQRFLKSVGLPVAQDDTDSKKSFAMNWKMTAKTILMQLHHKIETFESFNKHLVLALQQPLLEYMESGFNFGHIGTAKLGDAMHFHAYDLEQSPNGTWRLTLNSRRSTDAGGVANSLGLKGGAKIELQEIIAVLEAQLSAATLFSLGKITDVTPVTKPS